MNIGKSGSFRVFPCYVYFNIILFIFALTFSCIFHPRILCTFWHRKSEKFGQTDFEHLQKLIGLGQDHWELSYIPNILIKTKNVEKNKIQAQWLSIERSQVRVPVCSNILSYRQEWKISWICSIIVAFQTILTFLTEFEWFRSEKTWKGQNFVDHLK